MGLAEEADDQRAHRLAGQTDHQRRQQADRAKVCGYIDELANEFAGAAPARLGPGPWPVGVEFSSEGWKSWVSTAGVMVFENGSWEFVRPVDDKNTERGVWNKNFWELDRDSCRAKFVSALAGDFEAPDNTWHSFREGGSAGERGASERGKAAPAPPPAKSGRSWLRRRRD